MEFIKVLFEAVLFFIIGYTNEENYINKLSHLNLPLNHLKTIIGQDLLSHIAISTFDDTLFGDLSPLICNFYC